MAAAVSCWPGRRTRASPAGRPGPQHGRTGCREPGMEAGPGGQEDVTREPAGRLPRGTASGRCPGVAQRFLTMLDPANGLAPWRPRPHGRRHHRQRRTRPRAAPHDSRIPGAPDDHRGTDGPSRRLRSSDGPCRLDRLPAGEVSDGRPTPGRGMTTRRTRLSSDAKEGPSKWPLLCDYQSGRRDLNPRPQRSEVRFAVSTKVQICRVLFISLFRSALDRAGRRWMCHGCAMARSLTWTEVGSMAAGGRRSGPFRPRTTLIPRMGGAPVQSRCLPALRLGSEALRRRRATTSLAMETWPFGGLFSGSRSPRPGRCRRRTRPVVSGPARPAATRAGSLHLALGWRLNRGDL